jgi:hypothetical protein
VICKGKIQSIKQVEKLLFIIYYLSLYILLQSHGVIKK